MNLVAITVISFLGSYVKAAPQGSNLVPSPSPDKCGPVIQTPGIDPSDSCTTKPSIATSPASYSILNISYDDQEGETHEENYDWTSCAPITKQICDTMTDSGTKGAAWYFETSPSDYSEGGHPACQAGFVLPDDPAAASIPSFEQCQQIFNAMAEDAGAATPAGFGASINLRTNPDGQPGQWSLPGGSGTGTGYYCSVKSLALTVYAGAAVNAGYPSYVIAVAEPPTCTNNHGYSCKCATGTDKCADSSGTGRDRCVDEWALSCDYAGDGSDDCEG